jgi:hypothetical protein
MQLCPGEHQPKLADREGALDHLDLIKANLGAGAGVPRVEMRKAVIIEIPRDHDPVEAADRRHHDDAVAGAGRSPRASRHTAPMSPAGSLAIAAASAGMKSEQQPRPAPSRS